MTRETAIARRCPRASADAPATSRDPGVLPITVAIPVRNEEANLARCLERLGRFADVVVIDSGSADATLDIAENYGARIVQFRWNGGYPKKRNWFLLSEPPRQPWILFLDADEIVDDAFCDTVAEALRATDKDGFWLRYENVFLGRTLRHGVPQRKLALFRSSNILYERIDEDSWSGLDMEVHEHPIISGPVGEILVPIEHRDVSGIAKFIARHGQYAEWEARRYVALRDDEQAWRHLTRRQRFKYRSLARWWYAPFYFIFSYVLKRGFLDGSAGFHYAFYKAWYFHTIRLTINEIARAGQGG